MTSTPRPITKVRVPIPKRSDSGVNIAELAFIVLLGFLGAAAVSLYRSENPLTAAFVLGLPLGAACVFRPRIGIYAYGFWQAWDSAAKFGGGTQPGWVTGAKLLAVVVVLTGSLHALTSPHRISGSRRPFGYLIALCAVATVSIAWSYDVGASIRFAAQMWLQLVLGWIIVKLVGFNRSQMIRLMFWVVVGAFSASVYVLLFGMQQHTYLRATLGDSANPVSVAAALVTGLSCAAVFWALISKRAIKALLIPVGLVILFAIFATGTRAAVAAVGAGFLSIGFLTKAQGLGSKLALLAISVLLVVVGTFAALNTGVLSEQSESRLRNMLMLETHSFDPDVGIPRASRERIWLMSLQSYMRTYLIGTGVGASPAANEQLSGRYKDVHSSIVASLTELGPLGFFVFVALHFSLLLRIRRLRARGLQGAALVVFVGFVLMGSTHTVYTTKWFWLPVTILLAILELDAREGTAFITRVGRRA